MTDGQIIDAEINGLTADSRSVEAGFLFAALEGAEADGRSFIPDAIARGAAAVLSRPDTDLGPVAGQVPLLSHENPRQRYAELAARFNGPQPGEIAAITGTNGKTSVAEFTRQIWQGLGLPAASLGTLGLTSPTLQREGGLTTPDPFELHQTLSALKRDGTDHVALEASSHGLDQYRLDGAQISIAAFTNLSRDHLDYHGSMEQYLASKARLFSDLLRAEGTAILNGDAECYAQLTRAVRPGARVITYGRSGGDLVLTSAAPAGLGQELRLQIFGAEVKTTLPLIGEFQAMNALCALAIVLAGGAGIDQAVSCLSDLKPVPGRMQLVAERANSAAIYVDYAHTPDALERVLDVLKPLAKGKLIVVFGCGGDRDTGKRAEMGRIANHGADIVIVTDDNPRSEDAAMIRAEILAAAPGAIEIGDRRQAIFEAVSGLSGGDILVIAGKGHETGQIVGTETLPFDDAEMVQSAMEDLGR